MKLLFIFQKTHHNCVDYRVWWEEERALALVFSKFFFFKAFALVDYSVLTIFNFMFSQMINKYDENLYSHLFLYEKSWDHGAKLEIRRKHLPWLVTNRARKLISQQLFVSKLFWFWFNLFLTLYFVIIVYINRPKLEHESDFGD